jgi:hypothetical protein
MGKLSRLSRTGTPIAMAGCTFLAGGLLGAAAALPLSSGLGLRASPGGHCWRCPWRWRRRWRP